MDVEKKRNNETGADQGGYIHQHSFPLFVLTELSKIRTHPAVVEVLSTGLYNEQYRAFIDEVHQCLFCLYGCPSRRKRQLEEHGGSHNHEPSAEDVENMLSLLLPEKIPPYDGSCSVDLIEFVQKKASSFLEPTAEESEKVTFSYFVNLFSYCFTVAPGYRYQNGITCLFFLSFFQKSGEKYWLSHPETAIFH
ncbi:unnamed protein product [Gongylonema pulchrum]|uniref:SNF2_N domain-containing protein n=1 Tax=Gongylonema pulchrum TaxID=637853 RepID=A0A183EWW7_9BILA|nr:unnamed protein product [Gongylonema pulchrum]